ncbi:MAG: hypothetical protein OEZ01_01935 [Candidatus Heimdallarchaeota archaeon]|nr:hypothetical protein [Candidatus Heimdallarchaeota archaeon]MDH5644734.1 hypothetical protein [Candidatus Heimdallarchaeota archaeon]
MSQNIRNYKYYPFISKEKTDVRIKYEMDKFVIRIDKKYNGSIFIKALSIICSIIIIIVLFLNYNKIPANSIIGGNRYFFFAILLLIFQGYTFNKIQKKSIQKALNQAIPLWTTTYHI